MIYIAHRGILDGPSEKLENHPDQIKKALDLGFDCEIDVWFLNDRWYLGHDEPQYSIAVDFLINNRLWVHCKNIEALSMCPNINRFWHQNDDYTLTWSNYIWTYPGKKLCNRSICVMPEWDLAPGVIPCGEYAGVCSDYILAIKGK